LLQRLDKFHQQQAEAPLASGVGLHKDVAFTRQAMHQSVDGWATPDHRVAGQLGVGLVQPAKYWRAVGQRALLARFLLRQETIQVVAATCEVHDLVE